MLYFVLGFNLQIRTQNYDRHYLADDCRLVTDAGVRRLRSADTRTLVVGRTQSSFGDRTPRLWNSLPSATTIRQPGLSCGQFRQSRKTFFGAVGPRCSSTLVNCALETLLLTCLYTLCSEKNTCSHFLSYLHE